MNDALIGDVVDGRWKITERLGAGGMGTVYRAERIKVGKAVALKFLDERCARSKESVARFDREARATSRLQHAHCVSMLDFGVHRGRPFIVMEYVAGRRLGEVMGKPGMTPVRAVAIMRQLLEALRHAHAHGVVHRDLKPDNVMLTEVTGQMDFVKVLDFGLARIISVEEKTISLPALVAGTPSYMSPEQAAGRKVDHRTDIYSAGVILYGMCVGRKPFRADDTAELLRKQREEPPPPPRKTAPERGISEALERVILKAMAKSPDDRYYTAADFLRALEATPEWRAASRPEARRGGRRALRLAVALLLVALGAGGALWARAGIDRWRARVSALWPAAPARPDEVPAAPAAQAAPEVLAAPAAQAAAEPATAAPAAQAQDPEAPAPTAAQAEAPAPAEATPPPKEAPAPPAPATAQAEAPAAPAEATPSPKEAPAPATDDPVRAEALALLEAGRLDAAEKALRAALRTQPRAAWAHRALGEIYFRRLWRKDAIAAFEEALRLDPDLRHDQRLAQRLCVALGPKWEGAGARLFTSRFADALVPALESCIDTVGDLPRLKTAAALLERAAGRAAVDRGHVALRALALATTCEERREAVQTLGRLREARAREPLERLEAERVGAAGRPVARHACLGNAVQAALARLR